MRRLHNRRYVVKKPADAANAPDTDEPAAATPTVTPFSLAPFEAAPDASACAAKLTTHQPRSGSLPRDNIDQCCEVRLAANSTSIRLSPARRLGFVARRAARCSPALHASPTTH